MQSVILITFYYISSHLFNDLHFFFVFAFQHFQKNVKLVKFLDIINNNPECTTCLLAVRPHGVCNSNQIRFQGWDLHLQGIGDIQCSA